MSAKRVVYCRCAYAKVVPAKVKDAVLMGLSSDEASFEAVPDLCELSARKDPALADLANDPSLQLVACFPRAVRWLFNAAGHELNESAEVLNMRAESAGDILARLGRGEGCATGDGGTA